jgi:hypothetical protein
MKRIAAILIAIIYTTITCGFTVDVHYCMGQLAGVKLQSHTDHSCNKCGKAGKCCKDELKFCKVSISHEAAKTLQVYPPVAQNLHLPVIILPTPPLASVFSFTAFNPHAPPGQGDPPLHILHCVFRC